MPSKNRPKNYFCSYVAQNTKKTLLKRFDKTLPFRYIPGVKLFNNFTFLFCLYKWVCLKILLRII